MKSIVIIGAGQLGSRHLQALRLIDEPIRIQVVDPSHESLKVAEERFNQVKKDFFGEIHF
jgi:predicted dehydrogenase